MRMHTHTHKKYMYMYMYMHDMCTVGGCVRVQLHHTLQNKRY